jgi:hypothetical protein
MQGRQGVDLQARRAFHSQTYAIALPPVRSAFGLNLAPDQIVAIRPHR